MIPAFLPSTITTDLESLLAYAQTLRIQQVQLAAENPAYKEQYGEIADRAWADLNRAHERLTGHLGGRQGDRLFRRADGTNPWAYPEHLGDRILWVLTALMNNRIVTITRGDSVLIERPHSGGYKWWIIGDNGGELTVAMVNDPETEALPGIACTNWRLKTLSPMAWAFTVAAWVQQRLRGEPIDYEHYTEDNETIKHLEDLYQKAR